MKNKDIKKKNIMKILYYEIDNDYNFEKFKKLMTNILKVSISTLNKFIEENNFQLLTKEECLDSLRKDSRIYNSIIKGKIDKSLSRFDKRLFFKNNFYKIVEIDYELYKDLKINKKTIITNIDDYRKIIEKYNLKIDDKIEKFLNNKNILIFVNI